MRLITLMLSAVLLGLLAAVQLIAATPGGDEIMLAVRHAP